MVRALRGRSEGGPMEIFLPLDENNSDPPTAQSPRQSYGDPVTAAISGVTLHQQLPDAAWPGVAVAIRIASLLLN